MVLYKDDLMELEYAAAQDVLFVELSGNRQLCAADLRKVFVSAVACIRDHAIKNLLVNFGRSTVDITDTDYKVLMSQLTVGLMPSTIKKIARVALKDPVREQKIDYIYSEIKKSVSLTLLFKNFTNRADALLWLMEE